MEETHSPLALIVDDDKTIGQLVEYIFQREGFRVKLASDGRDGKTLIETIDEIPAFILLDIMMPFHDGIELLKIARAKEIWQFVPIIMLSGRTQEQEIIRALELGATDYVLKPFRPNELVARVKRHIRSFGA